MEGSEPNGSLRRTELAYTNAVSCLSEVGVTNPARLGGRADGHDTASTPVTRMVPKTGTLVGIWGAKRSQERGDESPEELVNASFPRDRHCVVLGNLKRGAG